MKTVYLDNNCYGRLAGDKDAYRLLLSLSHHDRGLLSFESSPDTIMELAARLRTCPDDERYIAMLRDAHRLVRQDRVFRFLRDLALDEVRVWSGEIRHLDLWHAEGSPDQKLYQQLWQGLSNGKMPTRYCDEWAAARDGWVSAMELCRQEAVRGAGDEGYDPSNRVTRRDAIYHVGRNRGVVERAARLLLPGAARLPEDAAQVCAVVEGHLHAFRTLFRVLVGFSLTRISATAPHIDAGRSLKGQGKHTGAELYDLRHAAYGRYVDYFVTEDCTLREIGSMIDETDANGDAFTAWSLAAFLREAERIAAGVQ